MTVPSETHTSTRKSSAAIACLRWVSKLPAAPAQGVKKGSSVAWGRAGGSHSLTSASTCCSAAGTASRVSSLRRELTGTLAPVAEHLVSYYPSKYDSRAAQESSCRVTVRAGLPDVLHKIDQAEDR